MIMCICLLGTLGTSWMGVVSVTFPGLGTTAGVGVGGGAGSNMLEILKKNVRNIEKIKGLLISTFFFFLLFQPRIFLK